MRRLAVAVACVAPLIAGALVAAPGFVSAHPLADASHCAIFPANNPWNQRVDRLPVAKNSASLIARIGLNDPVHPDFGSGLYHGEPIGIQYAVVGSATRKVPVTFQYASESDKGPYPLPPGVPIEGGSGSSGDRHVIVVDRDSCTDYELYAAYPHDHGLRWSAGSGAIFNLRSDHLRPAGWTSGDAAGLPILPGLVRWSEVASGHIDHALRFTVEHTRRSYVYPARHFASDSTDANLPPMGLRVRLGAEYPISGFPPQARVLLQALKTYGMIVADNGSSWYVSGEPNAHWSNDDLHTIGRVAGSAFEVVDTSSLRPKSK